MPQLSRFFFIFNVPPPNCFGQVEVEKVKISIVLYQKWRLKHNQNHYNDNFSTLVSRQNGGQFYTCFTLSNFELTKNKCFKRVIVRSAIRFFCSNISIWSNWVQKNKIPTCPWQKSSLKLQSQTTCRVFSLQNLNQK